MSKVRTTEDDIAWMNTVHAAQKEEIAKVERKRGRPVTQRERFKIEADIKDAFHAVDRAVKH